MKADFLKKFDFLLLAVVFALILLGVMFIYTAGVNSNGVSVSSEYLKQIVWAGAGFLFLVFFALVDYRKYDKHAKKLFLILIGLLVLTRLFGKEMNGSRSWLRIGPLGIQPSEGCKILFIIFLAHFFQASKKHGERYRFVVSMLIFFVPFALIMLQPDLGTASVFFLIYLSMLLFSGISIRYLMMILLLASMSVFFLVYPEWAKISNTNFMLNRILVNLTLRGMLVAATAAVSLIGIIGHLIYRENRYFYWIAYFFGILSVSLIFSYAAGKVMKQYQIERLVIFINPEIDPRGGGWQTLKSLTTVGSGGVFGKGFLNGHLVHSGYLPESSTDFIFGTLSEELGFVGSVSVILLYLVLFVKILLVIRNSTIAFGTYIASGIFGMFFWHFIENVGMVISCMPITGIPLLFLSYGGSSLITAMGTIGLLMSVRSVKYDF